jgi:NAD(P)-dependent dehydrogenase (short-subunit alcohol dehydrogenase family)
MACPENSNQTFDLEIFDKVMKVNLYGSIYTAKSAAEAMRKNEPNENNQRGCIVLASSICGDAGSAGQIPYSSTKSALNGLVLPMARDLGFLGIRAMAIAPGTIHTPITDKYLSMLGVPPEGV